MCSCKHFNTVINIIIIIIIITIIIMVPLWCLMCCLRADSVSFIQSASIGTSVSRSPNNSNQNNSRRFISWRFTNYEPCAICLKNMNTKSFRAYKINIIACARALQLPFIRTSESGEINSQHPSLNHKVFLMVSERC